VCKPPSCGIAKRLMRLLFFKTRQSYHWEGDVLIVDGPLSESDIDGITKIAVARHAAEKMRAEFAHLVATGRAHPSEHIGWREEQQWLLTRMG
jgi:hypothetical protein